MPLSIRAFASPTLIQLCFDWPEGTGHADFVGFAIKRTPGVKSASTSYLTNLVGFDGPSGAGKPEPGTDVAPIQGFHWWDSAFAAADARRTFTYTVTPVLDGTP